MKLPSFSLGVGNRELMSSHFFCCDRSLLNGSGNQRQVGLFSQIAADASVVIILWVDALDVYGFPFRQFLDLGWQSLMKQGFHLNLGI